VEASETHNLDAVASETHDVDARLAARCEIRYVVIVLPS